MTKTASASHGSFGVSASLNRRAEDVRVLTVIITELELGHIQRHIFPAHFVKCANNTALENRPEAFDGLSVNCTDNILPFGVVNNAMRIFTIEPLVANPLIGQSKLTLWETASRTNAVRISGDHARNHIALAADRADDWGFAGTDATSSAALAALIPVPVLGQAADERFIDFDDTAELINVLHEGGSDLVAHEPSGFIGTEPHVAIKLQSAHAFLANEHQVDDAIPIAKRLIGIFKDRSGDVGKAVGNTISTLHALPLKSHGFKLIDVFASATRATYGIGPATCDKICATRGLIWKQFVELCGCELVNWLGLLTAGHETLLSMERSVA
jgi:hypothetical protein